MVCAAGAPAPRKRAPPSAPARSALRTRVRGARAPRVRAPRSAQGRCAASMVSSEYVRWRTKQLEAKKAAPEGTNNDHSTASPTPMNKDLATVSSPPPAPHPVRRLLFLPPTRPPFLLTPINTHVTSSLPATEAPLPLSTDTNWLTQLEGISPHNVIETLTSIDSNHRLQKISVVLATKNQNSNKWTALEAMLYVDYYRQGHDEVTTFEDYKTAAASYIALHEKLRGSSVVKAFP